MSEPSTQKPHVHTSPSELASQVWFQQPWNALAVPPNCRASSRLQLERLWLTSEAWISSKEPQLFQQGTVETMRHSQVKNLLLPGLISKDLIHIPTHTGLGRFRSLPNMTKIVLPYAQWNYILWTLRLKMGKIRFRIFKNYICLTVHIHLDLC